MLHLGDQENAPMCASINALRRREHTGIMGSHKSRGSNADVIDGICKDIFIVFSRIEYISVLGQ